MPSQYRNYRVIMPAGNTKGFESERQRLLNSIEAAFSDVRPPDGWEKYSRIEDFERDAKFGEDFLPEYWRYIYDLEPADTKYVLPFVMKYFVLLENLSVANSVNLELLFSNLDPAAQHAIGFGYYFEKLYSQFSDEQKRVVCAWLKFLKTYANELACADDTMMGAISFWCD